ESRRPRQLLRVIMTDHLSLDKQETAHGRKNQLEHGETKPPALVVNPDNIPQLLRDCPHWVSWRYERRADKSGVMKWTKIAIDAKTGRLAASDNPSTWSDFATTLAYSRSHSVDGIGFVFSEEDPFAGIDLDDCLTENGSLTEWAAEAIRELDSYTEISPTQT